VIRPALKGEDKGIGPVILAANCTNCGRCIDVCSKDVFNFGTRYGNPVIDRTRAAAQTSAPAGS
jgi:ferredoxin-type protein NapH